MAGHLAMSFAPTKFAAIIALGLLAGSATPSLAESPPPAPGAFTVISPVFGQLVRFSMPTKFMTVSENTKEAFYIREAVLKGETINQWSQMITITGAKGLASAPNFSPQGLAGSIAGGFKKTCPDSFAAKGLGETKFGDRDAFVAVAGCGKVGAGADQHSETALIVAVKGTSDAYTIQWAERSASISSAADIDEAKWQGRLRELMPIRLCAIVAGEAAPYPSCLQQK
jgi:hypothetical protein